MSVRETRNRGPAIALAAILVALSLGLSYRLAFADDPLCMGFRIAVAPVIDGDIAGDQGWAGANQYVFSNGIPSQPDAVVQMVRDGTKLYLSFDISNDPEFNDKDAIILILSSGTSDSTRIHIYPVSNGGNGTNSAPREIRVWKNTIWDTDPAHYVLNPTWIFARVTATTTLGSVGYRVEVSIETGAAGLNLPAATTTLKFHFNVLRLYSFTSGGITEMRATQLNWPSAASLPGVPSSPTDAQLLGNPPRATWGDLLLSSFGCQGVHVDSAWINTPPHNSVLDAPPVGGTATNSYYVAIGNSGTAQAGHVLAGIYAWRFGIAGPSSFGQVPATPNPVSSYSVAQPGPIGPGDVRRLGPATWTIDRATYVSTYQSNPLVCSLIQLDADNSHPAGVTRTLIANRYFYFNTHFAAASDFRHSAVLDTRGFQRPIDGSGMQHFDLLVSHREIEPRADTGDVRAGNLGVSADTRKVANPLIVELAKIGGLTAYNKREHLFGWSVCAMRHTGKLIKVDGTVVRLMERTPCYGYWLHHAGKFRHWRHEFDAPRLQKKAGTGTLYSIDVPVDSSVNLVTHIEAVEAGFLGSLPWWLWLLVALVLLVVAASRFMRSRSRPTP